MDVLLEEFESENTPKGRRAKKSKAEPHKSNIIYLLDKGYSQKQIVEFLQHKKNVHITHQGLSIFIRKHITGQTQSKAQTEVTTKQIPEPQTQTNQPPLSLLKKQLPPTKFRFSDQLEKWKCLKTMRDEFPSVEDWMLAHFDGPMPDQIELMQEQGIEIVRRPLTRDEKKDMCKMRRDDYPSTGEAMEAILSCMLPEEWKLKREKDAEERRLREQGK